MRTAGAVLSAAPLLACGEAPSGGAPEAEAAASGIFFTDVTEASGLAAFRQVNGDPEKPYIVESIGAGVALLDHDGDGDLDAYLSNGSSLAGFPPGAEPRDALFENDGRGRFRDATDETGLGHTGWTQGVRVADHDADGRPDLFLTCFGPNVLYRNLGGRFEDVTERAGVGDGRWSAGACFVDFDRDGDLDLYVANYVRFDEEVRERFPPRQQFRGLSVYFGPTGLPGERDQLLVSRGDGTFEDASARAGIDGPEHYGFQPVALDFDEDGWIDVFVANDAQPNLLWRNLGDGSFEDAAFRAGVAYSRTGTAQSCMGVAVGDADGDLRLDLFVSNFSDDYFTLYRAAGGGRFEDVSWPAGLARPTYPSLGWAAAFEDFDSDGDFDLFVANGHVFPQVDRVDIGTRYAQENQVFENDGSGRFLPVAPEGGLALRLCSRGAAFGDVDGDGDVDVLVGNLDGPPTLLRNDSPRGQVVVVRLVGAGGNRDAVGARVHVTAGGRTQLRAWGSAAGFLSSDAPELHFGLGGAAEVAEVLVVWPAGAEERFGPFPARRALTIEEGLGVTAVAPIERISAAVR